LKSDASRGDLALFTLKDATNFEIFPFVICLEIIVYRKRERANMYCQGIACTKSFYMGLTSAEGQRLEF
jgi:hypothetical protein